MTGLVSKGDYAAWCRHYGYDPEAEETRREWQEAREALAALQRIDARHEAQEAIEKAKGGSSDA